MPRLALRRNLRLIDRALIALAFASLAVFVAHRAGPEAWRGPLLAADLAMTGAYAALFVTKWSLARHHTAWLRRHLILAPGILPLTVPLLAEPWMLLHQGVLLAMRLGKALDRAFGEHVVAALGERYKMMIVEELSEPLLLRLSVILEESVASRDYAAAVGRRLRARHDLVEAAVGRAVAASPKLTLLTRFGPGRRMVEDTTREIVEAAHAALTGPELNALVREAWREAFAELREGIARPKWKERGVGLGDVAAGLRRAEPGGPMEGTGAVAAG